MEPVSLKALFTVFLVYMGNLPHPFSSSVDEFHLLVERGYKTWCMECDFALTQPANIPKNVLEKSPFVSDAKCNFTDSGEEKTVTRCMYITPTDSGVPTKMLLRIRHLDQNGFIFCNDAHCNEGSTKVIANYYENAGMLAPRHGVEGKGGFYGFVVRKNEGEQKSVKGESWLRSIYSFVVSEKTGQIQGEAYKYECLKMEDSDKPLEGLAVYLYEHGDPKKWRFLNDKDKVKDFKENFFMENDKELCPM